MSPRKGAAPVLPQSQTYDPCAHVRPYDSAEYERAVRAIPPGQCVASASAEQQETLRRLVQEGVLIFWREPYEVVPRGGFWKPPCAGGQHRPGCRPDRLVCLECNFRRFP
ncbi:hypothetical protein [Deinococcus sp. Leaf326]|uniref:hypothetical protein n=1 Tax=Deinococcus sp. Leaf326 TaxID=1736338 RepID=UPI0012E26058|nr:hypothetical protein [Deinococcus sp. Leaf326]